jgi:hypothetical protein
LLKQWRLRRARWKLHLLRRKRRTINLNLEVNLCLWGKLVVLGPPMPTSSTDVVLAKPEVVKPFWSDRVQEEATLASLQPTFFLLKLLRRLVIFLGLWQ